MQVCTHTHTHAGCIYPALQQRPSVSQLDHMGDSQQAAGLSPDHLHCRFGLQQHGLFHSVLITNICDRTDKHLFVCSVNFLHFVQYTVQLDHTMYWTVVNPYNNICNYMWRCLSRLKVEELFSQRCFSSHPRGFLDESSLTELFNLYVKMMEIVVDRLQGREVTAGWGNLMGCMLFLLLFSGQFLSKNSVVSRPQVFLPRLLCSNCFSSFSTIQQIFSEDLLFIPFSSVSYPTHQIVFLSKLLHHIISH